MTNPETNKLIDHVPSSEELQAARDRTEELEEMTLTPGAFKALSEGATKSVVELNLENPVVASSLAPVTAHEGTLGSQVDEPGEPMPLDNDLNAPARPLSEIREIVEQVQNQNRE